MPLTNEQLERLLRYWRAERDVALARHGMPQPVTALDAILELTIEALGDLAALQAENAALREAAEALTNGLPYSAPYYIDGEHSERRVCVFCGHFALIHSTPFPEVSHAPDCPVARARALLAQETDDAAE